MPIIGAVYASSLKSIGFPKTAAEAQLKWEQAWTSMTSGCTQAIKTGLSYSLAGAFEPTSSTTAFATKLATAGMADIASFVLKPNNGTTTPPAAPLGWSPSNSDSKDSPMGDLGDKMASYVKSATATGIPPDFTGLGPLS